MMEMAGVSWAAVGLGGANLGDARLNRRLARVAEHLGAQPGASIPVACGDWLPCDAVLDPAEWRAVYVAIHHRPPPVIPPPLPTMLDRIARLGGHLGRQCDGPPGPQALWIGLQHARDLAWGMQLASDLHTQ